MNLEEFCLSVRDRVGWAFEAEEDGSAFFYVDVAPDTVVRAHISSQIMSDDLDQLDDLEPTDFTDLVDSFVGSIVAEVEYLVSVGRVRGGYGDVDLFVGGRGKGHFVAIPWAVSIEAQDAQRRGV